MDDPGLGLKRAGTVVLFVGVCMIVLGIVLVVTAPPAPRMPSHDGFLQGEVTIDQIGKSNDDWIEGHERHNIAVFRGMLVGGFGVLVTFIGGSLLLVGSQRVRKTVTGIAAEAAGTIARGVKTGLDDDPKARLEQLEELRKSGLVSEEEFQAKRREIVDKL
jgi:uncharacterized membrane protein